MAISNRRAAELRQRVSRQTAKLTVGTKGVPTERPPLWNESPNVKHKQPLWGDRKNGHELTADKVYPKRPDPYEDPYVAGPVSRLGGVALPDKRWQKK